jgi:biotin-dependent carboxylase-like uncharacterized protein
VSGAALRIVQAGPATTVQDLGRPGWFSAGVGVSGAADVLSLRLANRLVGNDEGAAALECLLGGLEVEALTPVTVAVTGAPAPVSVDAIPAGHAALLHLHAGQHLRLGLAEVGMRVYVAVRGGIDVPPVLGSRSTDTLAGLGPPKLDAGQVIPVGHSAGDWPLLELAPVRPLTNDPVTVRVTLGPRDDWFTRAADLFVGHWVVSDRLDRVGARLERPDGMPLLTRRREGELATEGMPLGAIQVPPSGEPVVFLADHPITGGYPVVGVVRTQDVPAVAQVRPGQHLLFHSPRTGSTH